MHSQNKSSDHPVAAAQSVEYTAGSASDGGWVNDFHFQPAQRTRVSATPILPVRVFRELNATEHTRADIIPVVRRMRVEIRTFVGHGAKHVSRLG